MHNESDMGPYIGEKVKLIENDDIENFPSYPEKFGQTKQRFNDFMKWIVDYHFKEGN